MLGRLALVAATALVSSGAYARVEIATLPKAHAERLLAEVIAVGVAAANCPDIDLPQHEQDRLVRVTDLLAARLGVSNDELDGKWYDQAFDAYDANSDGFCAKWKPRIAPILSEIPL